LQESNVYKKVFILCYNRHYYMQDKHLEAGSGLGIDIVPVARFLPMESNRTHAFLQKVFLPAELDYCFAYQNVAVHLAGHFALKEAVSKALGVNVYPFAEIEIRHAASGAPEAWHRGQKLAVRVSISHTDELAVAIAAT
jgi:holo-[acyl-carrier protein] synthase